MKNSTNLQGDIKLIPKNKQKDFLVYYDEFNGNISGITTQKPEVSTSPYIIDSTNIAEKIVRGELSITKYAVGYKDYEANELSVVKKTNLISFVKRDADLYKVPRKSEPHGITFIYYTSSQLLEIEFNSFVLGNYIDPLWKNQFKIAFDEEFIIYLIDKRDPDILYARYRFPLQDVLEEGAILIPDFSGFNSDQMEICTKRHFRDYSLVIRDKFVETEYHRNKLGRLNMVKNYIDDENTHIELIQNKENELEIISHLEASDLKTVAQYDKQLKFYICSDKDPDHYEHGLNFDWTDLIPNKHETFNIPYINLTNKLILYSGNKIKITFKEKNNYAENTNN